MKDASLPGYFGDGPGGVSELLGRAEGFAEVARLTLLGIVFKRAHKTLYRFDSSRAAPSMRVYSVAKLADLYL